MAENGRAATEAIAPKCRYPIENLQIPHDNYILFRVKEKEQYNIYNYTFHGDVMINSLLRGHDDINTYLKNIPKPKHIARNKIGDTLYTPEGIRPDAGAIMFLPLYEMRPELVPVFEARGVRAIKDVRERSISRGEQFELLETRTKLEIFNDFKGAYTLFLNLIRSDNLAEIRAIIYRIIKNIYTTLYKAPKALGVYCVYRVVEEFYLSTDPDTASIVCSFVSTTASHTVSRKLLREKTFGDKRYIFEVHPKCVSLCIDLLSYYVSEMECLLGIGCKFVFKAELDKKTQLFAVLPPDDTKPEAILPPTYDEYIAKYYPYHGMPELETATPSSTGSTTGSTAASTPESNSEAESVPHVGGLTKLPKRSKVHKVDTIRAAKKAKSVRLSSKSGKRSDKLGKTRKAERSASWDRSQKLNLKHPRYSRGQLYDRDHDLRDGVYEVRELNDAERTMLKQMG